MPFPNCNFFILQIVDGFFVKRTHDLKESVAYLTVMTRHLQKIYSVSFSYMCPLFDILCK